MANRISVWGVGPLVGVPTACYGLAAAGVSLIWPATFALGVPYAWLAALAVVLLAVGAAWYVAAVRAMFKAYREERLLTGGLYAVCRHPIYASWILFLLPALGLVADSWLVLSTAAVMYVLTRLSIGREERGLEAQFGRPYAEYRRRTNAIFPTLRRRRER